MHEIIYKSKAGTAEEVTMISHFLKKLVSSMMLYRCIGSTYPYMLISKIRFI